MTIGTNIGRRVFKHGLIAASFLACLAVQAEHNETHARGDKAGQFIQKALQGGQMEVQMGQLAQQKAQSQDVKNLGAALVKDHTQANQELQQLASAKNVQTAPEQRADHKEQKQEQGLSKLQNQSGGEFDKTFVRMAIKDHKKDISEFERARTDINDPALTAFIDKTLPTLRSHLQMAEAAAKTVGVDTSKIVSERELEAGEAVGGAAPGVSGVSGSSEDRSSDRLNGAADSDASGTIKQNNPSAKIEGNVGDHQVNVEGNVNNSASSDTTAKHKIFQKGDGKVLGLSTDKNDGKFLGIIPDPHKKAKTEGM